MPPFAQRGHRVLAFDARAKAHEFHGLNDTRQRTHPECAVTTARHDDQRVGKRCRIAELFTSERKPVDGRVHPPLAQPALQLDGRERVLNSTWTCGASRVSRSRRRTPIKGPTGCGIVTKNSRLEVRGSKPRVSVTASRTAPSAPWRRVYTMSATGVGRTPRDWRMNSSSLNKARSRVSEWLTAGWVIASRAAARDRLRSSYAASKTGSRFRSTPLRLSMANILHTIY